MTSVQLQHSDVYSQHSQTFLSKSADNISKQKEKIENEVEQLHIAICDDEENGRIYMRKLIQKQAVSCKMTEFSSGEELLEYQNQEDAESIDILFLDISMGDGDGITVARKLRSRMESRQEAVWGSLPLLIFVTGYTEYMPEAFEVNAFQYILKPIRENDFSKVFAQAVREYQRLKIKKQIEPKEILVRNGGTTRRVPVDDIYYIESRSRKVILYLKYERIEYYDKIRKLEEELQPDFFRIHRGYLINMRYVEQYDRTEVRMKNGDSLLISKYKYQDFVKGYLEYISEET